MRIPILDSLNRRTFFIVVLIILLCVLAFFVYLFVVYGPAGVMVTIFGLFLIFAFFIWLSKEPRRNEEGLLERAERRKAYQQETGRRQAERDFEERERKRREQQRREDEIFKKPPWLQ
jgi:hypothetical protein